MRCLAEIWPGFEGAQPGPDPLLSPSQVVGPSLGIELPSHGEAGGSGPWPVGRDTCPGDASVGSRDLDSPKQGRGVGTGIMTSMHGA